MTTQTVGAIEFIDLSADLDAVPTAPLPAHPCTVGDQVRGSSGIPQAADLPPVSVIVPATDVRPTLPRCLEAIEAARDELDEVIVVTEDDKPGPASARNLGAAVAAHPILVFIDADVEIRPDSLLLIKQRLAADRELTAVFGSYDDEPEARDVVSTFRNLLHHYVHQGSAGTVESFWAGIGAIRKTAFEQAGGFDERMTHPSVEDIELASRLKGTGRIELDPLIQGKHLKRWTMLGMLGTDLRHRGIPWTRLVLRGRATRRDLNLSWRHRLSAASSLLMLVSVAQRRAAPATASLAFLVATNQRFYALLGRRGRRYALAGVALHVVHHLTSVLALLVGIVGFRSSAER